MNFGNIQIMTSNLAQSQETLRSGGTGSEADFNKDYGPSRDTIFNRTWRARNPK